MITYGFYNSLNYDRRYDSVQISSIFDGIIRDGIFMSIGTCFRVIPAEGMMVLVGAGRAWFNHTWTLNDAPLPVYLPQSEVLLDRVDAIVLDINADQMVRANNVVVIKGTPSKTPQRPALVNTTNHHQYPLAYISVRAGVTGIRAADITSMVGTSSTPYVTGILETVNIDALTDQWKDQWKEFYEKQTAEMEKTTDFWEKEWQAWYEAQTNAIQNSYNGWVTEWETWSSNYKTMMNNTADEWKTLWDSWFYNYINQSQQQYDQWMKDRDAEFKAWLDSLQVLLDGDVATNLASRILELEKCCQAAKKFMNDLRTDQAIYDVLEDSDGLNILDSNGEEIGSVIRFATT